MAPAAALADIPVTTGFDAPRDSAYATNTVIDIIQHDSAVWLATGRGLNASYDAGMNWLLFDEGSGLVSENISAAFSYGDRLWVGSSHIEVIDETRYSISDGVSYSDDFGETWTQIDFSSSGQDILFVWGGDQTIFDITGGPDADGQRDWRFFTAFAGGFLASQDGGMSWRRIYPSVADSVQFNDLVQPPSLRNRYFSCVADSSHGDSMFVWTGTAGGIFQYVYAPTRNRFSSDNVFAIANCDFCSDSSRGFLYLGGENGVTRGSRLGGMFMTRSEADGLPGSRITAMIGVGDRLLVGTQDTATGASTGLAVSTDFGETYSRFAFPGDIGDDRHVQDFSMIDSRLYMAAGAAGLLVSQDSGATWERILYDSATTSTVYNTANGLATLGDSLLIGTDTGLVCLTLDGTGAIIDQKYIRFADNVFSGAKVIGVRVQYFESDTLPGLIDSTVFWTVNREMSPAGSEMIARSNDLNDTLSWASYLFDTLS